MRIRFVILSILAAMFGLASSASAQCADVDTSRTTGPSWTVYEFFKAKTTVPLPVDVVVREPVREGKVEFLDGGTWRTLKSDAWVTTTSVRVTPTAQAVIAYRFMDCGDIIEAEDK